MSPEIQRRAGLGLQELGKLRVCNRILEDCSTLGWSAPIKKLKQEM